MKQKYRSLDKQMYVAPCNLLLHMNTYVALVQLPSTEL